MNPSRHMKVPFGACVCPTSLGYGMTSTQILQSDVIWKYLEKLGNWKRGQGSEVLGFGFWKK